MTEKMTEVNQLKLTLSVKSLYSRAVIKPKQSLLLIYPIITVKQLWNNLCC